MNRNLVLGYSFSAATAVCYGITGVLAKVGVSGLATPMVGTTVSLFAGMAVLCSLGFRNAGVPQSSSKRSTKWGLLHFVLAGVASFVGVYTHYSALSLAPMIAVSPLVSTNPLVTVFLAFFFLRGLEKVTARIVVASILIISGGMLIILGPALSRWVH